MKRLHTFITIAALLVLCLSCKREQGEQRDDSAALPEALQGFAVTDRTEGLIFSFADPQTGKLRTVQSMEDVPAAVRENVVVFSRDLKKGDLPANLMIVANLTEKGEDGSYQYRLVSRYVASGKAGGSGREPPVAARPSTNRVILYKTNWCPHCRTAAQWLRARQVPFVEKDVETDAAARSELAQLGRKQGLADQFLNSVPILYVNGRLVLGFNQTEIERLLAR